MFSHRPAEQAHKQPNTYGSLTAAILLPTPVAGTGGQDPDAAGIQRHLEFGVFKEEMGTQAATLSSARKRFRRFIVAAVGGIALVGPMLLMSLHPGRTTSLVTTSVAVLLAAVALAFLGGEPESVLMASAAYAAVLIVFVGASLPSGK